ncbi:hypothetical protein EIP91_005130 [Steccherinum ochraceum]|uniref:F-box domain-containing protein n=1 Tax=Steccherinum ochraceum TaxID=92696 RepID=A0A4R0R7L0_9APHY|nr:hypothetical protein EIP91_005130 [Steccherinum ochraceum]
MLRVEDLNQDCLELIFAHLSVQDLFALSLASRTLLGSVTPRLYQTLVFHSGHAKRYSKILNAFTVVQQRPYYAVHVRAIDIRAVPMYRGAVHSTFLQEYVKTIQMSHGLVSFTCTQSAIIPQSLRALQGHSGIRFIRINSRLSQEQTVLLQNLSSLEAISFDNSTWNVIHVLPGWTYTMANTLSSLTLYSLPDLNDTILAATVSSLPNLRKFHVINCGKIQHDLVIRLTAHTPNLPWGCSLTSIVLRPSMRTSLHDTVITDLLNAHDATLQHVMLLNCGVSINSMRAIASQCAQLDKLGVSIPHKDIYSVAMALSRSSTLETLQDISDTSSQSNTTRPSLTKDNVRVLVDMVPGLQKVIAWDRVWTAHRPSDRADEGVELTFEKRRNPTPSHWFEPPTSSSS